MRIGVLGAGITGLTVAKLLSEDFTVEILEKSLFAGGIAKTKNVEGISYHKTGGHCFNSKHSDVLDFVFNKVLPKENWHLIKRNAAINFIGHQVSYPIEYSVKEIYYFNKPLAFKIVKDFLSSNDDNEYSNLDEWFRKKFGNTLAESYFLPYNRKIWNKDPRTMSPDWVEGKLPIPDKESFFASLIEHSTDEMPHSYFYYPISNNQNTFIDQLASNLNIRFDEQIESISLDISSKKWNVNNKHFYDKLISTLPLNELPNYILNCPESVRLAATKLKYNKVSTMLWESKPTDKTWTYLPDEDSIFHRYIHIGNFFKPRKNYTITEAVGEKSYDEMVRNGKKDPFLIRPIDHNISNHAYVVYDENYKQNKEIITNFLDHIGIYSIGRFGEWEYYNMDVCIKRALDLSRIILNREK